MKFGHLPKIQKICTNALAVRTACEQGVEEVKTFLVAQTSTHALRADPIHSLLANTAHSKQISLAWNMGEKGGADLRWNLAR